MARTSNSAQRAGHGSARAGSPRAAKPRRIENRKLDQLLGLRMTSAQRQKLEIAYKNAGKKSPQEFILDCLAPVFAGIELPDIELVGANQNGRKLADAS